MLLIVLPVAWVVLVTVALTMLHTVALSDEAHDAAVARWLAADTGPTDANVAPWTLEQWLEPEQRGGFRATG
jgi:hypothetical protein